MPLKLRATQYRLRFDSDQIKQITSLCKVGIHSFPAGLTFSNNRLKGQCGEQTDNFVSLGKALKGIPSFLSSRQVISNS